MILSQPVRKASLVVHIVTSLGWLGAVAVFLVFAIAGLASTEEAVVSSAYVAMNLSGWYVIVPLCFASFASGLVLALGTAWGLLRHYWVLLKFAMTIPSTLLLLMHLRPIDRILAATASAPDQIRALKIQLVIEAIAALVVLIVATILSIYKPRGTTRFGPRQPRPT